MEFEKQLTDLVAEQKTFIAKANEEIKSIGDTSTETKTAIATIREKLDAIQTQADALDLKMNQAKLFGQVADGGPSIGQQFTESNAYKEAKAIGFRVKGGVVAPVEKPFDGRKSIISTISIGSGTTGVQMPTRLSGLTGLAKQELRIRDLMNVIPATGNSFDYVRQSGRTNVASPQLETSPKSESTYSWDSVSGTIKTIAHFTNVTRQALSDVPWLRSTIDGELMYGLLLKEEAEILAGDGTGQHLNGLITQATARATTYDVSGDTRLDRIRHAKLQARLLGLATFAPDGIVLNPVDMHWIELIKTEEGAANKGVYIIGDPQQGSAVKFVWGLPVVESDSISVGTFLLGAFGTAATILDREEATTAISFEHASNFTSNNATILCEERIGLAVMRPNAFVTGTFS